MTACDWALALARLGFWIFPIVAHKKMPPVMKKWQDAATRDVDLIAEWWESDRNYNVGISTSKFGDSEALLVVDVDVKGDKNGYDTLLQLELDGRSLPETRSHATPTSGRHLAYRVRTPVRQGANILGPGVDVRSRGGYVVGPGSTVVHGSYTVHSGGPVADAPQWLIDACGIPHQRSVQRVGHAPVAIDPQKAKERAIRYLETAPLATEGEGGDDTTFKVAAAIKDLGVSLGVALGLLSQYWNPRCTPPWAPSELDQKVRNAYEYGQKPVGANAPEVEFPPLETPTDPTEIHPYQKMNEEHAFVTAGGGAHILWETTDQHMNGIVEHLDVGAFKLKFAPHRMMVGKKESSVASQWLEWKGRRSYDGIIFSPGQERQVETGVNGATKRYFNLWRGFSCTPADHGSTHAALDQFLEHTRINVCGGNESLNRWLLGYFAHLVQRPWEKPLVSLVFRGGKGVGKNACIERVGHLLGRHYLLTSNRRYLTGNFNGHLENCLLFALDEAFWSGDKQAEGTIKDLITGQKHVIEHKGKEPYEVANKTRVVIIGNEDWLIPASHDERRFAVFDVGDGRKQDRAFFQTMREGMEHDGYPVLLRYLLDYSLAGCDVNCAPSTQGLADQKLHSLNPFHQWWHQCIVDGRLVGSEFEDWPSAVDCERFRLAFQRSCKDRRQTLWHHEDAHIGKLLKSCAPSIVRKRVREGGANHLAYQYEIPSIESCRKEWDTFIQHAGEWEGV